MQCLHKEQNIIDNILFIQLKKIFREHFNISSILTRILNLEVMI